MARCWVLTFDWNLHPAHFAALCSEEGLWPLEGQALDHPSYQQWGGRRAWQDDRHYTAAVQWWSSILILHFCLEPLAIQTLLVAVAIVTKKDLFDDAHKMQDISWHWMFFFSFLICVSLCCNAVSFVIMKWHTHVIKLVHMAKFTVRQCSVTTDITHITVYPSALEQATSSS